jgi:hypothetical protein
MTFIPSGPRKRLAAAGVILVLIIAFGWWWFSPRQGALPAADLGREVESRTPEVVETRPGQKDTAETVKLRFKNGEEGYMLHLKGPVESGKTVTIHHPGGGTVQIAPIEGTGPSPKAKGAK